MGSPEPSLEHREKDKPQKTSSQVQAIEPNTAPLFRTRKRSQKARKKSSKDRKEHEVDEDERVSRTDLLLIKEAQAMREKTRVAALDTTMTGRKRHSSTQNPDMRNTSDNVTTIGLRNNFAVERSSNVMDEHMNKYIDEGIREKFGDQQGNDRTDKSNKLTEENLYAIPEYLKVEDGRQYDPGEGMPAAGVEEIELSDHVRLKNEMETLQAREKLHDAPSIGNRSESANPGYPKSGHRSSTGYLRDVSTKSDGERHQQTSQTPRADNTDGKKRRFRHATDNLVADRFRKRWRR